MRILAAAGLLALLLGSLEGAAASASTPVYTYKFPTAGFDITLPESWYPIPRTKALVQKDIAELDKGKTTVDKDVALTYHSILSSATAVKQLSTDAFQAFTLLDSPILTEVSVVVVSGSSGSSKTALTTLGEDFRADLAESPGAKVAGPKIVVLPAGEAAYIQGTVPAGGGLSTAYEIYLIPHKSHVYDLTFEIDSRYVAEATVLPEIADHFALSS